MTQFFPPWLFSGLILLLGSIFLPSPAYAWGLHYLITERALQHPSMAFTDEKLRAEPIEGFLEKQKPGLETLFEDYYSWLKARGSKRFVEMRFDPSQPTRAMFLKAARLNPSTQFPLVERLLPGSPLARKAIAAREVMPYDEVRESFDYRFQDATGIELRARSVLVTFSDEPDWQMDRLLWDHKEYGYGEQPYGRIGSNLGTQAPFHMQFAHENIVVRLFASDILEGMVLERMELFSRLSALAFKTGHRYWGYRFAAWTMHYLQDLAQPYHSKAVPYADWKYYMKFIFSSKKDQIKKDTTQLVANRHFAYEDFVAYGLQQSFREKKDLYQALAKYLSSGSSSLASLEKHKSLEAGDMKVLMAEVMAHASDHALEIDRAVVKAFGPKITEDPGYDIESDRDFEIQKAIDRMDAEESKVILKETGKDFDITGRATRSVLSLILGSPAR